MGIAISVDDMYDLLSQEIDWHREHFNEIDLSSDFKNGFIQGLFQAKNLLIDAEIEVVKKWATT